MKPWQIYLIHGSTRPHLIGQYQNRSDAERQLTWLQRKIPAPNVQSQFVLTFHTQTATP